MHRRGTDGIYTTAHAIVRRLYRYYRLNENGAFAGKGEGARRLLRPTDTGLKMHAFFIVFLSPFLLLFFFPDRRNRGWIFDD